MMPFVMPRTRLGVAVDAPGPREGEIIRTTVPDTMEGIRFEMGRMVRSVQEAVGDPVVVDAARMILLASEPKNKISELGAIFGWSKAHFHYVSDPINKEYMQSARRMIRQAQAPRAMLARILAPIYGHAKNGVVRMDGREMNGPLPKALGDCEEAAVLTASLAGAVGILPRFRYGGAGKSLWHAWSQAYVPPDGLSGVGPEGQWLDMDITEARYGLGEHAPFRAYAHQEIFEN
jgi:hypothetical protein